VLVGVLLAQSWADTFRVLIWISVLIVFAVVGGLLVMALRRRVLEHREPSGSEMGTPESMREMVARGEMTREEYEQVRLAMVGKIRGQRAESAPPEDRFKE